MRDGKFHQNFTSKTVWKMEKFTQMSLCRGAALKLLWAKINAKFFLHKVFDSPSGHGRPRRKLRTSAPKSAFSCGPGGGEKLFDPWASGRKGQECPREIRTKKFMFMLFFFPALIQEQLVQFNLGPKGWDIVGHLQGLKASPYKTPKKVRKGVPAVKKELKMTIFQAFLGFLAGVFQGEAFDPCRWPTISQPEGPGRVSPCLRRHYILPR